MVSYLVLFPLLKRFIPPKVMATFDPWIVSNQVKKASRRIDNKFVEGSTLVSYGIGEAVYVNFLPDALEKRIFVAAPDAMVIGKGLEFVGKGMQIQRGGVSARKIVIFSCKRGSSSLQDNH